MLDWLKDNYEKVILWLILLSWVLIGWKVYSTWVERMNPSAIDRMLRPSKNWNPQVVNKDIKKGGFEGLLSPNPFSKYREIYVRNPFFPFTPFPASQETCRC